MFARLPGPVRVGLGFVLFGLAVYAAWTWWAATRKWVPLDVPISLAQGRLRTRPFTINVESTYVIELVVEPGFDYGGVRCMMGPCEGRPSPLRIAWSLSGPAGALVRGDSDAEGGVVAWDRTVNRDLGAFHSGKGRYFLDLDVLRDASRLNQGAPRLAVIECGLAHAENDSLGVTILRVSLFSVLAGALLIIGTAILRRRERALQMSLTPLSALASLPVKRTLPMPSPALSGVLLLLAGLAACAIVPYWMATRTFLAVDRPVTLGAGHLRTGPFPINLRESYAVSVSTGSQAPYDASCLNYLILKTRWILYKGRQVAARSEERVIAGGDLENFAATPGTYDLDVEVLEDASCLNSAHPRLRIAADTGFYADFSSVLLWLGAICAGAGASLLLIAASRSWQRVPLPVAPCQQAPAVRGYLRWKVRPSRRPFRGMPSFGLVAGVILVILVPGFCIIKSMERPAPVGLPIRILRPEMYAASSPGIQPLLVRIEFAGLNRPPKLYVDARRVSWEDFGAALQVELMRRPPTWPVYLDGDPKLEVSWPFRAIDRIRGSGAEVVLVTGRQRATR